jgi:hypothetical protein
MKTKGQFDIALVIVTIIFLFTLAPILWHLVATFNSGFTNMSVTNPTLVSPQTNATVNYINTTFGNFWDFTTIMFFIIAVIILFISALFVDMNPIFFAIYIVFSILLILLTAGMSDMLTYIYNTTNPVQTEAQAMTMSGWFATHMVMVALMIIFITGIIMFGKLRSVSGRAKL